MAPGLKNEGGTVEGVQVGGSSKRSEKQLLTKGDSKGEK